MHEVNLNQVITDYITGKEIQLTTYEDIRQALARLLVEEKGYPVENIFPKYEMNLDLGDSEYQIIIDFVVFIQDNPALILGFCPGAVSTFITQYVSVARLFPTGPVPFVLITDSKDAALMRVRDRTELCRGYQCIPSWQELGRMYQNSRELSFSKERLEKEKRIAHAMFALSDSCCTSSCSVTNQKT